MAASKVAPDIEILPSTTYSCPRKLRPSQLSSSHASSSSSWSAKCREKDGCCKPTILLMYRGRLYLVLTCQWEFKGVILDYHQHLDFLNKLSSQKETPTLLFAHRHFVLRRPGGPIVSLWAAFRQWTMLMKYREYAFIKDAVESRAMFSKQDLGTCQCHNCLTAYTSPSATMVPWYNHLIILIAALNLWAFIVWCALFKLDKTTDISTSRNSLQITATTLLSPPRIITQLLFFAISRGASTAIFSFVMISNLSDRKRLMAFLLAGADPLQGIAPKLLRGCMRFQEFGSDVSAFFTDFWVLLVAISTVANYFGDVTLAANRCDTQTCILMLWEAVWLGVSLLISFYVVYVYRAPVEILARHAFSEAAGTAMGFDFADVMRPYTTRLSAVSAKGEEGRTAEGKKDYSKEVAHFAIVPAGMGQGWLTADSYVVSTTILGEKVCGKGAGAYLSAGPYLSSEYATSGNVSNSSRNQTLVPVRTNTILPQYYQDIEEADKVESGVSYSAEEEEQPKPCPKLFDSGYCRATCMETVCKKGAVIKVMGESVTLLTCTYHNNFRVSSIYACSSYAWMLKQGYGLRHCHSVHKRDQGPIEMLLSDFAMFWTFVSNVPLREYIIRTCLNTAVDPGSYRTCACSNCQVIYAKRQDSFIWYMLTRPLVIFTTTFYMLYVAIYLTLPANLRPYNSPETESFKINKTLFQALFVFVTRGASFSIVNINITKGGDRVRLFAFLLASTDPLACIIPRLMQALFFNPRKYKRELWDFFTDFWLLLSIVAALGASYADVTVSAAQCDYGSCNVTTFQLALLVIGVLAFLLMAVNYTTHIQILARHAFSEAAGTCAGYNIKHLMDYYSMQIRKVSKEEAHLGIVRAAESDGVVLTHSFAPRRTALGQKII
ncbi:hypothetical protein HDV05_003648 [Chytridiales sp. JEL 0842]|nr:hypothetical protein HDV05_003648 [Chytridiales sp. JEL 0842]